MVCTSRGDNRVAVNVSHIVHMRTLFGWSHVYHCCKDSFSVLSPFSAHFCWGKVASCFLFQSRDRVDETRYAWGRRYRDKLALTYTYGSWKEATRDATSSNDRKHMEVSEETAKLVDSICVDRLCWLPTHFVWSQWQTSECSKKIAVFFCKTCNSRIYTVMLAWHLCLFVGVLGLFECFAFQLYSGLLCGWPEWTIHVLLVGI